MNDIAQYIEILDSVPESVYISRFSRITQADDTRITVCVSESPYLVMYQRHRTGDNTFTSRLYGLIGTSMTFSKTHVHKIGEFIQELQGNSRAA